MEFKGRVTVYSIVGCGFCARAKSLLNELSVPFVDLNLDKRPDLRAELAERTGLRTVPQIFFNEKHIGGLDELKKLVSLCSKHTGCSLLCCLTCHHSKLKGN